MATNAPVVIINGQLQQLPSANKLGPITGGAATGEVMTQDQFGTNSTQMTPSGSPTFNGLTINTMPFLSVQQLMSMVG